MNAPPNTPVRANHAGNAPQPAPVSLSALNLDALNNSAFEYNLQRKGGYVLEAIELLNWGPFSDSVWTYRPDGKANLLIGDNGAGKSTIADAVQALLSNQRSVKLNAASAEGSKGTRTIYSYVRGAYGEGAEMGSSVTRSLYLRDENTVSIVLMQFVREGFDDVVTAVGIFTVDQKGSKTIAKRFILSTARLSISTHFKTDLEARALKRTLQNWTSTCW
ncbi:MAG: AAA family ATPase [Limnobacter sp.]|nr:AAA family ATPase [Limnobacter sp.]